MEIEFKTGALDDIEFWKRSGNKKIQNRITTLLKSIASTPENGIGKPEKLKGDLSGFWSRRINKEHRIIYQRPYCPLGITSWQSPDNWDLTNYSARLKYCRGQAFVLFFCSKKSTRYNLASAGKYASHFTGKLLQDYGICICGS